MCWCTPSKRTPWCDNCAKLAPRPKAEAYAAGAAPNPSHDPWRRRDVLQQTRAEHAIVAAMREVEMMAADPRLTDAVVLLQRAHESVADFVDGVDRRRPVDHHPV